MKIARAPGGRNFFNHEEREEKPKFQSVLESNAHAPPFPRGGNPEEPGRYRLDDAVISSMGGNPVDLQTSDVGYNRHSRERGNPVRYLRPKGPRIQRMRRYAPEGTRWIPAFAGITILVSVCPYLEIRPPNSLRPAFGVPSIGRAVYPGRFARADAPRAEAAKTSVFARPTVFPQNAWFTL
ncbi:MAG: hypothetical protein LBI87_02690 [Candidatus Accumulibacter sp.]|jgi:hypothetical protein|nr:hypothetical protein [Accumulibacter sp.]